MTTKEPFKKKLWRWIKTIPLVSAIAAYIVCNIQSIIFLGGFTSLALLTNLFPALMAFFLSAMYNEHAKERQKIRVQTSKEM